jgi:GntR family transcriptional regulator, transcriptional repressor for pyruvate dehydrogenase complex
MERSIGPTTGPNIVPGWERGIIATDTASGASSRIQADLGRVRKTKVYAEVAAQIQGLIAAGRLNPGDKLPPERELAEIFGVSRSSVRDAIRVLEMQGLVEPRHGDGTLVRKIPIDSLVQPFANALSASKDLAADLFDMRKMLEPPLARAAAFRATDDDVRALEQIVEHQAGCVASGQIAIDDDTAFHYRIAAAAKNQVVLRTMDILMDLLSDSRVRSLQAPGRAAKSLDGHRRILDAIRRRDPEAAAVRMRRHIEEIEGTLFAGGHPDDEPAAAEA